MVYIFYHDDLDGLASAAVLKYKFFDAEKEFIDIDYGQDIDFDQVRNHDVFLVDFSLSPFSQMLKLNSISNLVWIDHHFYVLEEYKKSGATISGLRNISKASCQLTWEYCFPGVPIPKVIDLIGRFDIWDLDDEVVNFQRGMLYYNFDIHNKFWDHVISQNDYKLIEEICQIGKTIGKWEQNKSKNYCEKNCFETDFEGHKALVVNIGKIDLLFFSSFLDQYNLFINFCRNKGKWRVGLISTSDDIDVGKIAKKYGGGGHKKAAGFICNNLPFEI